MEKICIPLSIIRNFKLSPRARIVWAELSVLPRNENKHFVVKTKEFSKNIGVCASTTRRAIKTLIEQKFIEQVGVFERHHKIFKFVHSDPVHKPVDKNGPEPKGPEQGPKPAPKPAPTPPPQPTPEPTPEPETEISEPTPAPVAESDAAFADHQERERIISACEAIMPSRIFVPHQKLGKFMTLDINLGRPLTDADIKRLQFGDCMFQLNYRRSKKEYPLLTGLNGHPRLDLKMYNYLVLDNPTETDMRSFYAYMEQMLVEFSQTPFVPRANMILEYLTA